MKLFGKCKLYLLALCLFFVYFKPVPHINVFSIGDSTMCNYDIAQLSKDNGGRNYPLRGWMMMMPKFFDKHVLVHNDAVNGKSSKNFRTEGYWKKVIDSVSAGDYVFIQFGPNDMSKDTNRHSDPRTTFRQNLINYITEVQAKGAYPVLFTSVTKRHFDAKGNLKETFGDYVQVPREIAHERNIPLVDLNKLTRELVQRLGPKKSKKLYLFIKPGKFTQLPNGLQDSTHLCAYGAKQFAKLAADDLKQTKLLPLADYIK
ncbi:MAG: lipolytic protein family [Mucilaginibacter sp.]|jgi:lysophospholipase L1-like esterase|nr:lipolytic protein family [Mucilaginibacter sp.]